MRRTTTVGLALSLSTMIFAGGCSSGSQAPAADEAAVGDLAAVDPASLVPEQIVGKGPNDEEPASPDDLQLTDDEAARVREGGFEVGVVMQTMDIDWSTLQVQGITETLEKYGVKVAAVTDANFDVQQQIADIQNMIQIAPDAIISIPVDDTATAEAYRSVSEAGIKLVFIHQAPRGLSHPDDYASVVSPDNQGNGEVAAEMLAELVPEGGVVGIVDYGIDFFTTNQRTLRVEEWLETNRPDIEVRKTDFIDPSNAGDTAGNFATANPDLDGLFVIWDAPAMQTVSALRAAGLDIPITTIDLGNEVAIELARGGLVKGLGAQRPYDQGVAEALATMKALVGDGDPRLGRASGVPGHPGQCSDGVRGDLPHRGARRARRSMRRRWRLWLNSSRFDRLTTAHPPVGPRPAFAPGLKE